MGYRSITFTPGEIYHICHRGLNKQDIFHDDKDRRRFLDLLKYCNWPEHRLSFSVAAKVRDHKKQWPTMSPAGKGFTDVLCYCLMNNHVHLLLRENKEHGISLHMQRTYNGFAKYFNTRHQRTGGLFTGRFRAVYIDGDEQFLHVSRYIHLNPYVAHITEDAIKYSWSSIGEYINSVDQQSTGMCHTSLLKSILETREYKEFMRDYADYARDLSDIQHLTIDEN